MDTDELTKRVKIIREIKTAPDGHIGSDLPELINS